MADSKQIQGARTALPSTGFSTLASGAYVATSAYDASTNDPHDVIIEVECATTNTPAGNKQVVVFLKASLDGSNFTSGPGSGTTTTDELDLIMLGVVPVNTSSTTHRRTFSVRSALGFCPVAFKVVPKNELGVALTSGAVYTAEISYSTV